MQHSASSVSLSITEWLTRLRDNFAAFGRKLLPKRLVCNYKSHCAIELFFGKLMLVLEGTVAYLTFRFRFGRRDRLQMIQM